MVYHLKHLASESKRGEYRQAYNAMFQKLFRAALGCNKFDYLCTLVRVGGMEDAGWDPAFETMRSFKDFSSFIELAVQNDDLKKYFRIALLSYCHALEMHANHFVMANLLHISKGQPFMVDPFFNLHTRDKSGKIKRAASLGVRIRYMSSLADSLKIVELKDAFDQVFNLSLRNSFSHSDYVMTDDEYRGIGHGGFQADFNALFDHLERASAFFEGFFDVYGIARKKSNFRRYYKMPNYETLETLIHDEILVGFKMHFSNGASAHIERTEHGAEALNVIFSRDGRLDFMVGMLAALEKKWKIDGNVVEDWDSLLNHH